MLKHNKMFRALISVVLILSLALPVGAAALTDDAASGEGKCTSFYMGRDVTQNGSYIWGRSEDLGARYAKLLEVRPAADHEPGAMYKSGNNSFTWPYPEHTLRYILCRDSDAANGPYTTDEVYAEVGVNERNVAVSASVTISNVKTTINSRDRLEDSTGIEESDVASIVLMQAETARHGCEILAEVYDTAGAASRDGIMISDPNEVWYFQALTGHQYVAVKCPDGKIGFSPNITGNVGDEGYVDITDTENVIASPGLVSIPKEAGVLVAKDDDTKIKIADTYASGMANHQSGRLRLGHYYLKGADDVAAQPASAYMDYFLEPRDGEKYSLYEAMRLLGYRGEGSPWEVANPTSNGSSIGNDATLEAHVFEVRPYMPDALATLEWLCMGPAEFGVYLPYYGSLVTDTFEKYYTPDTRTYNSADPDSNNAYWVFRELYTQCKAATLADRKRFGDGVRDFWERYQKSLIEQQDLVDAYMIKVYKESRQLAEEKATEISMRISEEAYEYAKQMLAELKAFKAAGTAGNFVPSALLDENALPNYAQVTMLVVNVEAGNGQSNVNFPIESANGKGYSVYLSQTGIEGPYELYKNVNYNSKGAHIKGLRNGQTYYVIIEKYDSSGVLLKSDPVMLKPKK